MSSSSSSTFHPGLTFATLVVQFAVTRGSVIASLDPRRKGSGETGDTAASPSATGSPSGPSSSGPVSSSSITSSIPIQSSASASSSSNSSSSISSISNTNNASSTSSSPASSALTQSVTRTIVRSDITTAGIVGIAVGAVAILVLVLMFLIKCIRRRRRAQGRGNVPRTGFLRMGSSSPVRPQTPVREMSQTQSSPLISSAVVSGATINPHLSQRSMSNTPTTLSPLIFPAHSPSLYHTRSLGSSSDRSAGNTTHTSGVPTEVLSSHDALSYISSLRGYATQGPGVLANVSRSDSMTTSSASGEPASPVSQQSDLHRVMAVYQKSLENDPKGIDVGRLHTHPVEDAEDPPPSYDA